MLKIKQFMGRVHNLLTNMWYYYKKYTLKESAYMFEVVINFFMDLLELFKSFTAIFSGLTGGNEGENEAE